MYVCMYVRLCSRIVIQSISDPTPSSMYVCSVTQQPCVWPLCEKEAPPERVTHTRCAKHRMGAPFPLHRLVLSWTMGGRGHM